MTTPFQRTSILLVSKSESEGFDVVGLGEVVGMCRARWLLVGAVLIDGDVRVSRWF